jgi:hypothetical protein
LVNQSAQSSARSTKRADIADGLSVGVHGTAQPLPFRKCPLRLSNDIQNWSYRRRADELLIAESREVLGRNWIALEWSEIAMQRAEMWLR